jgi:hypothetical protein
VFLFLFRAYLKQSMSVVVDTTQSSSEQTILDDDGHKKQFTAIESLAKGSIDTINKSVSSVSTVGNGAKQRWIANVLKC